MTPPPNDTCIGSGTGIRCYLATASTSSSIAANRIPCVQVATRNQTAPKKTSDSFSIRLSALIQYRRLRLLTNMLCYVCYYGLTMVLALFAAFDGHSVTSILVYSLLFSNLYIFNLYCLICNFCLYLSLGELVSFTPCCPAHCNFQSNFVSVLSTSCANKVSPAVK